MKIRNIITGEIIEANTRAELSIKSGCSKPQLARLLTRKSILCDKKYVLLDQEPSFVLIEDSTNIEYPCITNETIFIHLGLKYDIKRAGVLHEVKKGRLNWFVIGDRHFYIKGRKPSKPYLFQKHDLPIEERRKPYFKEYYLKNKERIAEYGKKYHEENREKWNASTRRRMSERRKDPVFRMNRNLRRRILSAIKDKRKSDLSENLLGCSWMEARRHIESLWKDGMSWDNYGMHGWHIDHIKPCASFDLSKPEQQKKCFHYTNLQPLWAKDNLKKGAKLASTPI